MLGHPEGLPLLTTNVLVVQADLPVFAFGESMGGLLLLMFALRPAARDLLRGVILSAPVIDVADSVLPPKPAVAVLRFLAKLFPR